MRKGRAALVGAMTLDAYQAVSAAAARLGATKEERRMPRGRRPSRSRPSSKAR
jgi:hypothetical protein